MSKRTHAMPELPEPGTDDIKILSTIIKRVVYTKNSQKIAKLLREVIKATDPVVSFSKDMDENIIRFKIRNEDDVEDGSARTSARQAASAIDMSIPLTLHTETKEDTTDDETNIGNSLRHLAELACRIDPVGDSDIDIDKEDRKRTLESMSISTQTTPQLDPYESILHSALESPIMAFAPVDMYQETKRRYVCDYVAPGTTTACGASFSRNSDLARHRRGHADMRHVMRCEACGTSFTRKDALKRHQDKFNHHELSLEDQLRAIPDLGRDRLRRQVNV
ncbi:hypothetical protein BZG36_00078 [Bifiguratus adelaidae]|uniref:C2H2-type domain-containing protein n=1 Tax=Bifiguratus adelaidae TaxID=1938954 RepID=A0A261Y8P5_9FUNG|nr:hypothetical protein BZG36_00078 [Bifiguratus adelaidae]